MNGFGSLLLLIVAGQVTAPPRPGYNAPAQSGSVGLNATGASLIPQSLPAAPQIPVRSTLPRAQAGAARSLSGPLAGPGVQPAAAQDAQIDQRRVFGWGKDKYGVFSFFIQISPSATQTLVDESKTIATVRPEKQADMPPELVGRVQRVLVRVGTEILPREPSLEVIRTWPRAGAADLRAAIDNFDPNRMAGVDGGRVRDVGGQPPLPYSSTPPGTNSPGVTNGRVNDPIASSVFPNRSTAVPGSTPARGDVGTTVPGRTSTSSQPVPGFVKPTLPRQESNPAALSQLPLPGPGASQTGIGSRGQGTLGPDTGFRGADTRNALPRAGDTSIPPSLAATMPRRTAAPLPSMPAGVGQPTGYGESQYGGIQLGNGGFAQQQQQPSQPAVSGGYGAGQQQPSPSLAIGGYGAGQQQQANPAYPPQSVNTQPTGWQNQRVPAPGTAAGQTPGSLGTQAAIGSQNSQRIAALEREELNRLRIASRQGASDGTTTRAGSRSGEGLTDNQPNSNAGNGNGAAAAASPGDKIAAVVGTVDDGSTETSDEGKDDNAAAGALQLLFVLSLIVNGYLITMIRKLLTRYRTLLTNVRSQTA